MFSVVILSVCRSVCLFEKAGLSNVLYLNNINRQSLIVEYLLLFLLILKPEHRLVAHGRENDCRSHLVM